MSRDLEPDSSAGLRNSLRERIATLEADLRTSEIMRDRLEAMEEREAIQYVEALEEACAAMCHECSKAQPMDSCGMHPQYIECRAIPIRALIERKAKP